MSDEKLGRDGLSRRSFLGAAAASGAGLAGAGLLGLAGYSKNGGDDKGVASGTASTAKTEPRGGPGEQTSEVGPGELDQHYSFLSGGQSGEVCLIGIPSMRELIRIPVFNMDSAAGWGRTSESLKVLNATNTPETNRFLKDSGLCYYPNGDLRHPHLPLTDQAYDGHYAYASDKVDSRACRIRLNFMKINKIMETPNISGVHGLRPQRCPKTGYIFTDGEHIVPVSGVGTWNDPKTWNAVYTAIDGETMNIAWQILVDGNLNNGDADYQSKYSFSTCYDSKRILTVQGASSSEQDWYVIFNLAVIEEGIKKGDFKEVDGVKMLGGRAEVRSPYIRYIPIPNSPHGCNTPPNGRYIMLNGKLSPTVIVLDVSKLDDLFAGKVKGRDVVVARPRLGLGPLHTAFDGRGNAHTTLFIDNQMVKWSTNDAIRTYKGEKIDPIKQKLDVHYQPGHNHTTMSETKEADDRWLVSLNKFSKDRFLNTGPLKFECDQLVDISGGQMRLVHDNPTSAEPHDLCLVAASEVRPKKTWDHKDPWFWEDAVEQAEEGGVELEKASKVIRKGNRVRVYMTAVAPAFSVPQFEVNQGDEVTIYITNVETIENLTHGFTLEGYSIAIEISPQATQSVTFKAIRPGMHWCHCQWFCHALHMEMSGQMTIKSK